MYRIPGNETEHHINLGNTVLSHRKYHTSIKPQQSLSVRYTYITLGASGIGERCSTPSPFSISVQTQDLSHHPASFGAGPGSHKGDSLCQIIHLPDS